MFVLLTAAFCFMGQKDSPQTPPSSLEIRPPARIAVIEVPNLSRDKWEDLKKQESQMARAYTEELFKERGFVIVADSEVDASVTSQHIDLKDEEQWTKPHFFSIGHQTNASVVIFIAIRQTRSKTVGNILLKRAAGEAQIESWCLDVSKKRAVLDDIAKKGEKLAPPAGNTGLRLGAVRKAVEASFESLLKEFPKLGGTQK